jgi:hypothetical protein
MENNQGNSEKPPIDLPEIIQDLKKNKIPDLNKEEIKQLFDELNIEEMFNDFNDSVKNLFDLMFKLADVLDLNKILDYFEKQEKAK